MENMCGFTAPDGERVTIFGEGGGQELAEQLDVPLLGKVPLRGAAGGRRRGPAAGDRGPGRPRRAGAAPRGARRHSGDAAGAARACRSGQGSRPGSARSDGTALPMA